MEIIVATKKVDIYAEKHNLISKWKKSKLLFENNPRHPSLHTELMEPKEEMIYSFRVDLKYRAIFMIKNGNAIVFKITNHYK